MCQELKYAQRCISTRICQTEEIKQKIDREGVNEFQKMDS